MPRRISTPQASLCASLVAVLSLGSGIAAWATLCPYGRIAQKASGGGPCQCASQWLTIGVHGWECLDGYACFAGEKDTETTAGGCYGNATQSTACHSAKYTWTEHTYNTQHCSVNQTSRMVAGVCTPNLISQTPTATDGWNGPDQCNTAQ